MEEGLKLAAQTPDSLILDVRNIEEYRTGHIPNSINIPLNTITTIDQQITNKNTPLFVYCLSGGRSKRACTFLTKIGYTQVLNIGGIAGYTGEIQR